MQFICNPRSRAILRSLAGCCWLFVSLLTAAESPAAPLPRSQPLRVLTTIAPIYSWTASVAGSLATVENLLPADTGPHDFQFRPRDVKRLESADLILMNGLGLEHWLTRTLNADATRRSIPRVEVTAGWPESGLIRDLPGISASTPNSAVHDHDHDGGANPHLWLDPVFARHAVTNILHALETADPAHRDGYRTNAAAYLERLTRLNDALRAATQDWAGRPVVTVHDAFPYFCRRYSLDLAGVVEEIPGNSPSPRHLAALMKVIRERHVRVIFTETQFNPRLARQLASDLAIPVAELEVLETGPLTPTAYEEGQRRNLETLRRALR